MRILFTCWTNSLHGLAWHSCKRCCPASWMGAQHQWQSAWAPCGSPAAAWMLECKGNRELSCLVLLGGPTCYLRVLHQLLFRLSRACAPPIMLLNWLGWVTRANEVVATLAHQGTRLMFLVGDDCIIACNGLYASNRQLLLELQRGVACSPGDSVDNCHLGPILSQIISPSFFKQASQCAEHHLKI